MSEPREFFSIATAREHDRVRLEEFEDGQPRQEFEGVRGDRPGDRLGGTAASFASSGVGSSVRNTPQVSARACQVSARALPEQASCESGPGPTLVRESFGSVAERVHEKFDARLQQLEARERARGAELRSLSGFATDLQEKVEAMQLQIVAHVDKRVEQYCGALYEEQHGELMRQLSAWAVPTAERDARGDGGGAAPDLVERGRQLAAALQGCSPRPLSTAASSIRTIHEHRDHERSELATFGLLETRLNSLESAFAELATNSAELAPRMRLLESIQDSPRPATPNSRAWYQCSAGAAAEGDLSLSLGSASLPSPGRRRPSDAQRQASAGGRSLPATEISFNRSPQPVEIRCEPATPTRELGPSPQRAQRALSEVADDPLASTTAGRGRPLTNEVAHERSRPSSVSRTLSGVRHLPIQEAPGREDSSDEQQPQVFEKYDVRVQQPEARATTPPPPVRAQPQQPTLRSTASAPVLPLLATLRTSGSLAALPAAAAGPGQPGRASMTMCQSVRALPAQQHPAQSSPPQVARCVNVSRPAPPGPEPRARDPPPRWVMTTPVALAATPPHSMPARAAHVTPPARARSPGRAVSPVRMVLMLSPTQEGNESHRSIPPEAGAFAPMSVPVRSMSPARHMPLLSRTSDSPPPAPPPPPRVLSHVPRGQESPVMSWVPPNMQRRGVGSPGLAGVKR